VATTGSGYVLKIDWNVDFEVVEEFEDVVMYLTRRSDFSGVRSKLHADA
jgi:hypothetical protein